MTAITIIARKVIIGSAMGHLPMATGVARMSTDAKDRWEMKSNGSHYAQTRPSCPRPEA